MYISRINRGLIKPFKAMMEISIRDATIADKPAVMAINDHIYHGTDYLPHYYDSFFRRNNTDAKYVAMVNSKVVGFAMTTLVNDKTAYIIRSGRVSQEVEGMGVFRKLNRHIEEVNAGRHEIECVSDENKNLEKESFRSKHKLLWTRTILSYQFNGADVHIPPSYAALARPLQHTDSIWKQYIDSPQIRSYIFPHDKMVFNWMPGNVSLSNIPIITPEDSTIYTNIQENGADQQTGLFSVANAFPVHNPGYIIHLDVYGTDVTKCNLREHLAAHLRVLLLGKEVKTAVLWMYYDSLVDVATIDSVFNDFNITNSSHHRNEFETKQYLYEKNIK